jgi:peptidyl-prolyl cis-trans isomerase C
MHRYLIVLAAAALLIACLLATAAPPATPAPGEVLARVGDHAITTTELDQRIARLTPEMREHYSTPEGRREFLRQLVRIEVFARRARELKMDEDPAFKARLEAVASTFLASDYMRRIAEGVHVSDEEARAYYQAHLDAYRVPEMIQAPQIVVKLPAGASAEELGKREARIEEARRRALAGEPWGELVKEYNENLFAGNDEFFPRGRLTPEVADEVFDLPVGEVSPVVHRPDALLLFKVEARRPARLKPFSEVREEVRSVVAERDRDESLTREEMALFARYDVSLDPGGAAQAASMVVEGRITGVRLEARKDSRLRGWVTIETEPPAPGPSIVLTVTTITRLVRRTDGRDEPISLHDLRPGQLVRVASSQPVAPTSPPRVEADVITITHDVTVAP